MLSGKFEHKIPYTDVIFPHNSYFHYRNGLLDLVINRFYLVVKYLPNDSNIKTNQAVRTQYIETILILYF